MRHHLRLSVLFLTLTIPSLALASDRLFTFTYEATTQPKGAVEYEQWVTWKTDKDVDSTFDRIDFRHELEFGITDNFQLGIYLSDWRYEGGRSVDNDGASWRNVAVEGILNFTSPTTDLLGLALYGEVKLGDELLVLEGKILLQKNIGPFVLAYNGIIEAEWEGEHFEEDIGEFGNTLGVSYQISPAWSVGAELVHEIEYEDWSQWGDHVVYAGPNIAFRGNGWWVTVTPLFQVTDVENEANFQTRLLFGIEF